MYSTFVQFNVYASPYNQSTGHQTIQKYNDDL